MLGGGFKRLHPRTEQLDAGSAIHRTFERFSLLIWPSACPLLQGSVIAFLTAARSHRRVWANCCRGKMLDFRASSSHAFNLPGFLLRKRPRNRIARPRMTTKLGEACFRALTSSTWRGVSMRVGFRQSAAATCGEICHPVIGSIALLSSQELLAPAVQAP